MCHCKDRWLVVRFSDHAHDHEKTAGSESLRVVRIVAADRGRRRWRDRITGKRRSVRSDPDAKLHKTGDNRWQFGSKFDPLMGLWSDSESLNHGLEDTLFIGRAHSVGKARQLVDLIGFATGVNAIAVYRAAKREAPPSQATA